MAAAGAGLAVELAAPRGELTHDPELMILFSRPVRRMDPDPSTPALPIQLTPAVRGHWEWIGTRVVRFVPDSMRFPRATQFSVTVPSGIRSVDGLPLEAPFTFSFATPRPTVSLHMDNDPFAPVSLRCSQPIADDEILRATTLTAGSAAVAFTVAPREATPSTALLKLATQLAPGTELKVTVDRSLRSQEGPLAMGEPVSETFRSYGPFELKAAECDKDQEKKEQCSSYPSVDLVFSGPVRPSMVRDSIRVHPAVKWSWGDHDEPSDRIWLPAEFEAGRTYKLEIPTKIAGKAGAAARPVTDAFGFPLAKAWSGTLTFAAEQDSEPWASLRARGKIIDTTPPREVLLDANRLERVDVTVARLELEQYLRLAFRERESDEPQIPGAKRWTVPLRGTTSARVALKDLFPSAPGWRGGGLVALGIPGKSAFAWGSWMPQVTDLGVSALWTPISQVVWVTQLSTGKPVAGAQVQMHGAAGALWPGVISTDADGVAYAERSGPRSHRVAFSASQGGQWSVVTDSLWTSGDERAALNLFTDRGIYRVGDTVHFKGIGRIFDTHGVVVPQGRRVTVRTSGHGRIPHAELHGRLDSYGTLALDWTIPAWSARGEVAAEACMDSAEGKPVECTRTRFQIADYRKTELAVEASLDRSEYIRGDTLRCTTRARYLFGGPVRGAKVEPLLHPRVTWFHPSGLDGFVVSASDSTWRSATGSGERLGVFPLLEDGTYAFSWAIPTGRESPVETWTCEPEVQDVSRQTAAARTTALVHPAEFYLGLRLPAAELHPGNPVVAEALAVEPSGRKRAGVPIKVELSRVAQPSPTGRSLIPVEHCQVSSREQPTGCRMTPREPGEYVLRATASDPRGNSVRVESTIRVRAPNAPRGAPPSFRATDDSRAQVETDRRRYAPGDSAHVSLRSTFAASEALVAVSREGVMSWRRVTLPDKTAALDLPITEDMIPEARITAVFLRGRTSPHPDKGPDPGAPAREYAETRITVDPASRHLKVDITPSSAQARPGSKLDVALRITDASGKPRPGQLTVYAVDEGVLSLTSYKTPDPFPTFFDERETRIVTTDTRSDMFFVPVLGGSHRTTPPKVRMGATSTNRPPGPDLRKDTRVTAFFHPDVRTDADGRAHVSFKLPETLTAFRVMAVAVAKDAFGSAESTVITSLPLMVRPALPRILRVGDVTQASVLVTSAAPERVAVNVTMGLKGAIAEDGTTRKVVLAPGNTAEVRFKVRAAAEGKAVFGFAAASSRGERDGVEETREVHAPVVVQTVALQGETDRATGERLGDLSSIHPETGGLHLSLSADPLAGLDGAFTQLLRFPYGCTEQLSSMVVPLLPLRALAMRSGAKLPEDVEGRVKELVSKLVSRQRGDGGFGFWAESRRSHAWVSMQALWALTQARKHGVQVNDAVMERAGRYAAELVSQPDRSNPDASVFALDVLAEEKGVDAGVFDSFFDARNKLSLDGQAMLLHGMATAGADRSYLETLAAGLESSIRVDGSLARVVRQEAGSHDALASNTRSAALVLRALVAMNPGHPMATRLAHGLMAARRGGAWRTTQENAWALIALHAWGQGQSLPSPDMEARVFLGQDLIQQSRFASPQAGASTMFLPASALLSRSGEVLAFEVSGKGKLFYEARLQYGLRKLPDEPLENGFAVVRRWQEVDRVGATDGKSWQGAALKPGGLARHELVVATSSPRSQVVVDCPVPAGLELLDPALSITSQADGSKLVEAVKLAGIGLPHDRMSSFVIDHREVRDDRMLFFVEELPAGVYRFAFHARATALGRFVVPPAMVQEMYMPETFGRTEAGMVVIE